MMGVRGNLQKKTSQKKFFSFEKIPGREAWSGLGVVLLFSALAFFVSVSMDISKVFFESLGFSYEKKFYIDDLLFPTLPVFVIGISWYIYTMYKNRRESDISLSLFRKLINETHDLIFIVEPQTGRILDANQAVFRKLGYQKEELQKKTVLDIERTFPTQDSWEKHVKILRRRKKIGILTEGVKKKKKGGSLPVEVHAKMIQQGNQEYIIAIARDLTRRKQHTEKLLASYKHVGVINRKVELLSNLIKYKVKEKGKTVEYLLMAALSFSGEKYGLFYEYNSKKSQFQLLHSVGITREQEQDLQTITSKKWQFLSSLPRKETLFKKKKDHDFTPLHPTLPLKAFLALPLISRGKTIGVIILGSDKNETIENHSLSFYDVLAVQSSRMFSHILEKIQK